MTASARRLPASPPEPGMRQVLWLAELHPDQRDAIGNKAARLAALLAAGFPVPPGFCITRLAAVAQADNKRQRRQAENSAPPDHAPAVPEPLHDLELSPALVAEVADKYQQLQARWPGLVAVRSSATAEDLQEHSFAGVYETVLGVADLESVLAALRHCWASYWSAAAVHYRAEAGLPAEGHGMAVLVQTMIQAKWAGVLFTVDPRGEHKNALVIESVTGTGEALVSGQAQAQRYWVDRATRQPLAAEPSSIRLADHLIRALADMGLAIEHHQGSAQDIEWAVEQHDRLWILQTRPVTQDQDDWASQWRVPAREWLASYDEAFSPLGCDLAVRRYDVWVRGINALGRTAFKPERRIANGGFIYYRPTWRHRSRPLRLWMQFWQLAYFAASHPIQHRFANETLPRYRQRLAALDQPAVGALSDQAVLASFDTAIGDYLDLQFSSYAIGRVAVTAASLLDRVCRLWFRDTASLHALDLLSGLEDSSVQRELALHRLGRLLAEAASPPEHAGLTMADLEALRLQPGPGQRLWLELHRFLGEYGYIWGDRYPRDPAWQLLPTALVSALANAASGAREAGFDERHRQQKLRREHAVSRALQVLARDRLPWRRLLFRWLLRRAEELFPFKEDRNHDVYRSVMVIRKYAQEIGRRLAARQKLPAEGDVFFLEWDEIKALWSGDRPAASVRRVIAQRKGRFAHGRRSQARPPALHPTRADTLELSGEACSPGVAVGRARLVHSLGELERVAAGDILVCSQLRPAWSQVFARAGGAVIELGSMLSHGSTLAREYGIPAVINVAGVTALVRDGDSVMVDGYLGRVVVQPGPSRSEQTAAADQPPNAHLVRHQ